MPKGDDDVPSHENGSRNYLADEVQSQRRDITELVKAVAGLQAVVRELVEDAREERKSAKEDRQDIREQVFAQRAEQQQSVMSLTAVQADVVKLTKTLGEIDGERRDAKTIFKFVSKSAKMAWALFGAAFMGLGAMIWKSWQGHQ